MDDSNLDKLMRTIAGAMPENTSVISGIGTEEDAIMLALQAAEADAEAVGWDQPAEVMSIFSFPEAFGMRTFPVPDQVLEDMSTVLPIMVGMLEERDPTGVRLLRRVLPENFFGIMVINEGWSVKHTAPDAYEAAFTRQLQYHPERVEVRFVICYTLDGCMRAVTRHRGELPESYEMKEQMMGLSKIPDLVRRLALLCKEAAPSYVTERQLPE
jgi:hypothetical protein